MRSSCTICFIFIFRWWGGDDNQVSLQVSWDGQLPGWPNVVLRYTGFHCVSLKTSSGRILSYITYIPWLATDYCNQLVLAIKVSNVHSRHTFFFFFLDFWVLLPLDFHINSTGILADACPCSLPILNIAIARWILLHFSSSAFAIQDG